MPKTNGSADLLAVGFGTTVAMWTVGYFSRLPGDAIPSWFTGLLLLACLLAGGVTLGRLTTRGPVGGAVVGLIVGVLNLLILGSLLGGGEAAHPSQLLWLPGSLVGSVIIATAGLLLASAFPAPRPRPRAWRAAFVTVTIAATLLLLAVGGVVTGNQAGLAVPDWPNSYGYNMFLYPLSRMTGGIYFEHAHRLIGSLVGLTTLVLALMIQFAEKRRWVRALAWCAFGAVVVQGIMGGLRVTGRFTLETSAAAMSPSIALAIVHGIFAQVFLGLLFALRAATSQRWPEVAESAAPPAVPTDRVLAGALIGTIFVQLVLGAIVRHVSAGLYLHITMAIIVSILAAVVGVRAWGIYPERSPVSRNGVALLVLMGVQLTLGFAALVATGGASPTKEPTSIEVFITTLHQTVGALFLACSVMLMCWLLRLEAPSLAPAPDAENAEPAPG